MEVKQNTKTLDLSDLTEEERLKLEAQNSRMVSDFQAKKLEQHCKKNWDLFYKRNETNFFKDRNWTTREFEELLGGGNDNDDPGRRRTLLEVGCGVGNLVFPLLDNPDIDLFIYACDFSDRAVEFVRANPKYDPERMHAFQCDITDGEQLLANIPTNSLDQITMIFVLSAIHPSKFSIVLRNLHDLLRPGGMVLFRDYGRYDMAQLRFKAGSKLDEHFYVRQDGTRTYFFTVELIQELFESAGFSVCENTYVNRRTINQKESLDVARIFLQGKFIKK